MTNRWRGVEALVLILVVGVAASCATTGGDVDVTPTARTSVDAHIGKSLTTDGKNVANISSDFGQNETVYAIVDVPGKVEGTIRVRWVLGTETVNEQTMAIQDGVNVYPFTLTPPAGGHRVGEYHFEVYINNDRAESEVFNVRAG